MELTFGPPKSYVMVSTREYGKYPSVQTYFDCEPNQKSPILLETMTMQKYIHESFERVGHLWERDEILLKIAEEVGELIQAYRKKKEEDRLHEFGDLLFSVLALAEREGIDSRKELCQAVYRFENHWTPKRRVCSCCGIPLDNTEKMLCVECTMCRQSLTGN